MDTPGSSSPTEGNQEPQRSAAAAATAYVHLNHNHAPAFFNPYAVAVAAMAAANQQQQMAQSQVHAPSALHPMNGYGPQVTNLISNSPTAANSTSSGGSARQSTLSQGQGDDMQSSTSSGNNPSSQNAGAPNLAQFPPFAFAPNFSAAFATFLGGGGFPNGGPHAPAPQQNSRHLPTTTTQHSNAPYGGSSSPPLAAPTPSTMAPPAAISNMPRTPAAVAAAQVVAAHAVHSSGHMANALLASMQHWKLDQLESHVQLLRDTSQPIPQPVAMMLADARRKEAKRTAKRVANRKSACSSRARKKALVEEMTKVNARLRRQALILALLPDLVIAITVQGEITFCSAQVERVLRHRIDHLVGANLADILTPTSRDKLGQLISELLKAEKAEALSANEAVDQEAGEPNEKAGVDGNGNQSAESSGGEGVVVSEQEQSFPLAVVKVESQPASTEENSDLSTSNGGSKVPAAAAPSHIASSFGHCGDDEATVPRGAKSEVSVGTGDATQVKSEVSSGSGSHPTVQAQTSSDDSFCSSNDARNLRQANEALDRNVRWHNEKLASKGKVGKPKSAHKDDVTGESVTANNADARLSSLQHRSTEYADMDKESGRKRKPSRYNSLEDQLSSSSSGSIQQKKKARKMGNATTSDDSGYGESSESLREDTFSSTSDEDTSSNQNGPRRRPLAPACNICLIRDDLTTIWCEVTSSIRTRSLKEEIGEGPGGLGEEFEEALGARGVSSSNVTQSGDDRKASKDPSSEEGATTKDEIKELLLCLRPIRDGEGRVDASLRFVPRKVLTDPATITDSAGLETSTGSSDGGTKDPDTGDSADSVGVNGKGKHRPPKKRPVVRNNSVARVSSGSLSNDSASQAVKKRRVNEEETETSAVELLMRMCNTAS